MCSRPVKHPSLHCLPAMQELYPSPKSPSSLEQKGSRLVRVSLGRTAPSFGSQVQGEQLVLNPLVYRGHCEHMRKTPSNHDPLVKNTLGLRSAYSYRKFPEDVPDHNQERPPACHVLDAFLFLCKLFSFVSGTSLSQGQVHSSDNFKRRASALQQGQQPDISGER